MQDTAPSIAKQLSYEGFPKRKSWVRSTADSEAGRIFESETTANQSEIRRAHLVSAAHEPKLWELRQIAAVDNLHKDLRMQDQIAEKVQVGSKKVIHIRKNDFKAKSDL